ncbi:copper amine oxidase N-terminal domain-containing protein [Paenibacillus qinlingensis]|uniref:copper amine oxidase N-terminal domain-containing protein n=1 Tax=Paenibacillus qinlingensis TaxID=1837343 RepID=UPI0015663B8D|nr:copper amine oxidase N-terminal domain-containing protein [Paenibacillus qinlingensis]NQX63757.1 copper amine oxidase N-terminal domain-containing protein [Paenibacillus qinlingensis]
MKKLSIAIASALISSMLFANVSFAADLKMKVNNTSVQFVYGTPFIDSGSSLLPLRDLLVALGVKNDDEHIRWNGNTQSVTIVKDSKSVILSVGSKQIYLNGKLNANLEVPAQNVNGRVFLPARAVAEALGYFVDFDSDTYTILVQNVPFGGGVKADDFNNGSTAASSSIETITSALKQYTDGVSLSAESAKVLEQNEQAFFSPDRSKLSLDKIAKAAVPVNIAKSPSSYAGDIVNITFMEIDSMREIQMGNDQTFTGAVGHTGGKHSQMTEKLEDRTYFQVFFLGKNGLTKGDSATVNGVVVGETTIELTNALGVKSTAPMYVIVAGNMISTSEDYDIRVEQSKGGKIDWSALDKETQERIERLLLVTLNKDGLLINDRTYTYGLEITKAQIQDYEYAPTSKTELPSGSLTIPLNSFKDSTGKPMTAQSGSFFVKITTNHGEFNKFVDFE